MSSLRKGESKPQTRFRANRFFHSMEQWYFITRESTVEGPFEHRDQAEEMLEAYLEELDATVQ